MEYFKGYWSEAVLVDKHLAMIMDCATRANSLQNGKTSK